MTGVAILALLIACFKQKYRFTMSKVNFEAVAGNAAVIAF